MIDMRDLTREERTLITISCEPFYIGYKENTHFKSIHNSLLGFFPPNHKKEVWTIITACTQALRHNMKGSMFSLRKANYTEANKRNNTKISYVRCKRVLDTLDEKGYITLYKGFYDHVQEISIKSCFIIESKLEELFNSVDFERYGNPRPTETLVEIRDSTTDELITSISKLRGIKAERSLVKKYNDFLLPFDIRCKSSKACAVYKRVYTDNLGKHGRWYSQSTLQTTKSDLRKYITIDGFKTTEVDYRQQHPRILMELSGINKPMSWEPYADINDVVGGSKQQSRKLSKLAMMCLINAQTMNKAKSALYDNFKKNTQEYQGCLLEKGSINKIFDRLLTKNNEISSWFGKKDLWAVLQHYDSKITASVLSKCMDRGICCLPWHDSYITESKHRDFLIETMRSSWEEVLGSNKNCFYKVEF